MRILKHGKSVDEERYFICWRCRCEYVALQSECTWEDGPQYGCGYVLACPDCGKENMGMVKDAYMYSKRK